MWNWVDNLNWVVCVGIFGVVAWRIWGRGGPERVGFGEPACPTCGYVVMGLGGARCPECGNDLENSGVVRVGSRRRWGWIVGAVVWTFMAWIGFGLLAFFFHAIGMEQFVAMREVSETEVVEVAMNGGGVGSVEIGVKGVGIGRAPKLERIWLKRGTAEKVVWDGGAMISEGELTGWLRGQGVPETAGQELWEVAEAARQLKVVGDLRVEKRWNGTREHLIWMAGVRVRELMPVESRGSVRVGYLFTSVPWSALVAGVVWIWGLRGMWPGPRRKERYVREGVGV